MHTNSLNLFNLSTAALVQALEARADRRQLDSPTVLSEAGAPVPAVDLVLARSDHGLRDVGPSRRGELLRLNKAQLLQALDAAPLRCEQLLERGLASASRIAEQQSDGDEPDLAQLATISTAGSRFDWLCHQFQKQEG